MVKRTILTSLLLLLVSIGATAATVTLPKTGQTLCYDANGAIDCVNTGQDGETQIGATWPTPRFTNNLNGTVTDNLTGLVWLQDALCTALNPPPANPSLSLQGGRDWASALAAANALMSGQCGLTDGSVIGNWRLPNVNEMESLMDISQSNPPLPANNHFINVPQTLPIYWTSTTTGDYFPGINAIGAVLFTGKIQGDIKTSLKYIWPVRGDSTTLARTGQNTCWDPNDSSASGTVTACNGSGADGDLQKGVPLPSPRFFDNVNGTITDSLTGLIWPKNAGCFSNITSQGQAITLAKTLANGTCDLADGSAPGDWRLPNRKELRSLVDYGGTWLAEFTGSPPHGWYWTSDSYAIPPYTSQKWVVKSQGLDWLNDELLTYQQLPPYFMLPVRGALKLQRITFNGPATISYGDPPIDLSTITTGGGSGNPVTFTLVSGLATLNGTTLTFTGGGSVVVKASQSGSSAYYPAPDTLHTFTVTSLSGTVAITAADLIRTYDGTPKAVTVTTSPAGMAVTVTYAGSATPPTNAGSYPVVATINDPTHPGSTSGTLVVGKAAGTVTITGGQSQTYDASAKSVTTATVPPGLAVTVTYNGSTNPPTNAGTYPVVATITDANYQGSAANDSLVIAKAAATVALGNLSQTYDGSAKGVTATTSPTGKAVSVSYAGNAAAPINAGSYAVIAAISDPNYQGSPANGTLVIAKGAATVTLGNLSQTYDGSAKGVTATTAPAGKAVSVSYAGNAAAPSNAGSYAVIATISDPNYQGSPADGTLVIAKAAATVALGNLSQIYDGSAKSATVTTSPAGKAVSVSYAGNAAAPSNAGSYAVIATIIDPNYQGSPANGTLVIAKAAATIALGNLSQTYDGSAKSAAVTTSPAGKAVSVSYAGNAAAPSNAGSYAVIATLTDPNYQGSPANGTLAIAKAAATVALGNLSQTYDGSAKSATVTTSPAGKAVSVSYAGNAAAPSNAGSYAVIATISDPNYQGSPADGTLVIAKAAATVALGDLGQTYDGTAKSATATTLPAGKTVAITYNGSSTAPTNAGSYAVVATVNDTNYAGSTKGTLAVSKATPSITWSTPAPIGSGTALSATQLNAVGSVPGTLVYSPALGAVPAAGPQTLSVTLTPTDATDYTSASSSVTLTVIPNYTVTFASGGNGSLTGITTQTVVSGASATAVTALPAAGCHFVQWTGDGGFTSTNNPLALATVTAAQTITANFAVDSFLITASALGGNGTISCASPVNSGSNSDCTVTPAAGYHLVALTDNSADRLSAVSASSFTITNVTGNHVVSAAFARPTGIVNQADGKTAPDLTDALAVLKIAMGLSTATASDLARADIAPLGSDGMPMGDGRLDIYDVIAILRMMIGQL